MKQYEASNEKQALPLAVSDLLTVQSSGGDDTCFGKTTFASPQQWQPNLTYLKEFQIFPWSTAVADTWLVGSTLNRPVRKGLS